MKCFCLIFSKDMPGSIGVLCGRGFVVMNATSFSRKPLPRERIKDHKSTLKRCLGTHISPLNVSWFKISAFGQSDRRFFRSRLPISIDKQHTPNQSPALSTCTLRKLLRALARSTSPSPSCQSLCQCLQLRDDSAKQEKAVSVNMRRHPHSATLAIKSHIQVQVVGSPCRAANHPVLCLANGSYRTPLCLISF